MYKLYSEFGALPEPFCDF